MIRPFVIGAAVLVGALIVFGFSGAFLYVLAVFPSQGVPTFEDELILLTLIAAWGVTLCAFSYFFLRWFLSRFQDVRSDGSTIQSEEDAS